jgi:hypothetical protein
VTVHRHADSVRWQLLGSGQENSRGSQCRGLKSCVVTVVTVVTVGAVRGRDAASAHRARRDRSGFPFPWKFRSK